jgi:hypothetical protein
MLRIAASKTGPAFYRQLEMLASLAKRHQAKVQVVRYAVIGALASVLSLPGF